MKAYTRMFCSILPLCILIIISLSMCGNHNYFPKSGIWYCDEADILLDFNESQRSRYKDEEALCVDYERGTDRIYLIDINCETHWEGESIFFDEKELIIKDAHSHKKLYFTKIGE